MFPQMEPEVQRNRFRQAISESIAACDTGEYIAVIVIKILDLHKFNATMGYDKTDELLGKAFAALTGSMKKVSTVTRFDGSSIGIVVNGLKFPHLIGVGLERVLGAVSGPFTLDDSQVAISANAGASLYPLNGESPDQLLIRAETALKSCETQAGRYQVYGELDLTDATQWQMESDLKSVVEARQLSVIYQPQIRLSDDSTAGFEALLRWNHPVHGFISPERFIPLAESSGVIDEITEWVLQTALRETIGSLGNAEDLTVSINVSPTTLFDPGFPFVIESAISLWGAVYEHFILEITEGVLMQDFAAAKDVLCRLRDKGAKISIDDFGTGYSSLAYFKQLPVDELKIDRSFVHEMVNDSDDFKLVEVMIQLAHKFGMAVVAEGVEDKATLEALRGLECDIVQGYHISKPIKADGLNDWLDHRPAHARSGQ